MEYEKVSIGFAGLILPPSSRILQRMKLNLDIVPIFRIRILV